MVIPDFLYVGCRWGQSRVHCSPAKAMKPLSKSVHVAASTRLETGPSSYLTKRRPLTEQHKWWSTFFSYPGTSSSVRPSKSSSSSERFRFLRVVSTSRLERAVFKSVHQLTSQFARCLFSSLDPSASPPVSFMWSMIPLADSISEQCDRLREKTRRSHSIFMLVELWVTKCNFLPGVESRCPTCLMQVIVR